MGILNATPDSFFAASRVDPLEGGQRAAAMEKAGAGIIDVGGESTRPGSVYVEADEETRRILPTLHAIREAGCLLPLSIDTRKRRVAEAAWKAGATWLNDVSALRDDPELGGFAAEAGMTVVLMHSPGPSSTMQKSPHYDDVVREVEDFLRYRVDAALAIGISPAKIVLDPGIGFGKTLEHNLALLAALPRLSKLGFPMLIGLSRKMMVGSLTGTSPENRLPGSLGGALACAQLGASILRVHDVEETVQALRVFEASLRGRPA